MHQVRGFLVSFAALVISEIQAKLSLWLNYLKLNQIMIIIFIM